MRLARSETNVLCLNSPFPLRSLGYHRQQSYHQDSPLSLPVDTVPDWTIYNRMLLRIRPTSAALDTWRVLEAQGEREGVLGI